MYVVTFGSDGDNCCCKEALADNQTHRILPVPNQLGKINAHTITVFGQYRNKSGCLLAIRLKDRDVTLLYR